MISQKPNRSQIFISYSRKDAKWLARLRVHLKPLERDYGIVIWDDTEIRPGSSWRAEIEKSISFARVAILLISADFLASDFIANDELPHLLQAANTEGTIILPIVVSPSLFSQTPALAKFQTVNDPAKPLTGLPRAAQEAIFVRVSEIVQGAFSEMSDADRPSVSIGEWEPRSNKSLVKKTRRIDAAVPSHATVNEHIDLFVQVRLADSPLLGVDDWPDRRKPDSVAHTAAARDLEFPIDFRTGRIGSARLEIRVVAPDFEIRGEALKFVAVPPDGPSELIKFLITAKRSGSCKIDVEVYKADKTYLGTIPLETNVDGTLTAHPPTVANLVLVVVVNHETEGLRNTPKDLQGAVKKNGQTESSLPWYKRTLVIVALIGAFSTFAGTVYKFGLPYIIDGPSHSVAVRGRVSDSQGRALGGAKVSLEGKGLPPVVYTDSEGVFSFDLPADVKEIRIRVEVSGYDIYDRRIDVSAKGELQDIRLLPTEKEAKAELSGTVLDAGERPLRGARVTLDDFPGMSPVETSSDGVFNLRDIPKQYGEGVRVRVVMEGYQPNPYTEDVVLGKAPPIIKLTRKR